MTRDRAERAAELVDTHVHLWDPEHGYDWLQHAPDVLRRRFSESDLASTMASCPARRAVLVEAGSGRDDEAERMLALASRSEVIAGVVAPIRWTDQPLATLDRLRACADFRWLLGVRDSGRSDARLDDRDARDVAREFARDGLVVELMTSGDGIDRTLEFADRIPEVAVIVDHAATPPSPHDEAAWVRWVAAIRALGERAHISMKISGLLSVPWMLPEEWTEGTGARIGEVLLEALGADRLMLGSDWPVCLRVGTYAQSLAVVESVTARASDAERDRIRTATACRVYRLNRMR